MIGSLAVTFATNVLFDEVRVRTPWGTTSGPDLVVGRPLALGVAVAAFVAIRRFDVNVVWVVLVAGAIGMVAAIS